MVRECLCCGALLVSSGPACVRCGGWTQEVSDWDDVNVTENAVVESALLPVVELRSLSQVEYLR